MVAKSQPKSRFYLSRLFVEITCVDYVQESSHAPLAAFLDVKITGGLKGIKI